jgi:hypothetical protein
MGYGLSVHLPPRLLGRSQDVATRPQRWNEENGNVSARHACRGGGLNRFSGGGSALLVRPEPGRSLPDLPVSPDNRAALPWLRFASGDACTVAWAPDASFPIQPAIDVVNTGGVLVCRQHFDAAKGSSCFIQVSRRYMALGCAWVRTGIQHLAECSGIVFFEIAVGKGNRRGEGDRDHVANGSRGHKRNHSGPAGISCEATLDRAGCFGNENGPGLKTTGPEQNG